MSRIDRLREYAKPLRAANWQGTGRDQSCIDRWSKRASTNSDGDKHRASDGPMRLPDKEPRPVVKSLFYKSEGVQMRSQAKSDKNFVGDSPFMKSVKREA